METKVASKIIQPNFRPKSRITLDFSRIILDFHRIILDFGRIILLNAGLSFFMKDYLFS